MVGFAVPLLGFHALCHPLSQMVAPRLICMQQLFCIQHGLPGDVAAATRWPPDAPLSVSSTLAFQAALAFASGN